MEGNFSKEIEILKSNQREILEVKEMVNQIKKTYNKHYHQQIKPYRRTNFRDGGQSQHNNTNSYM